MYARVQDDIAFRVVKKIAQWLAERDGIDTRTGGWKNNCQYDLYIEEAEELLKTIGEWAPKL